MRGSNRDILGTASLMIVAAVACGAPALAQDAAPQAAAEGEPAEAIVVTGTRIQNPNLVQSSPVQVVNAEEIALRQPVSAEELVRELPGAVPNIGAAVNNGANGSANIDLRGLGSNRNIVLLDGQRIVPDGLTAVADINNIPSALIERVDITTGGGSSVYGADAVAGVANFITKRDFSGLEANATRGITEQGDGKRFTTDLTVGANFDDGRGNAVLSIGYAHTDPVYQGDRSFSQFSLSSANGTQQGSGTAVPTVILFPLPATVDTGQIDPDTGELVEAFSTYNFNPLNVFQTPFKRINLYGAARYQATDAIEVFASGMFVHNEITQIIAPSGTFFNTYMMPLSNPYLPAGVRGAFCASPDIGLTPAQCDAAAVATDPDDPNYTEIPIIPGRRFVETGPRIANFTTDIYQVSAGARGALVSNLDWELRGQYGESNRLSTSYANGLSSRVQQALLATDREACLDPANGCVPIDLFGPAGSITPEMLGFIDPAPATIRVRTSLLGVSGSVGGDVGVASPLAENPIGFALGAEYREYKAQVIPDLPSQTDNEILGAGGATQPVDGGFHVAEFFGEVIAPLVEFKPFLHSLTLEAGIRYSDYSTAGGSTAWKAGASWEPVRSLKLRGIYQRAVRAPNIAELFTPRSLGLANQDTDPCQGSLPVGNPQLAAACIASGAPEGSIGRIAAPSAGQINISFGGNPDLQPEKARTITLGAVFTPEFIPGFSATVDYYDILIKDAITAPNVDDLFNGCYVRFDLDICSTIGRNPLNGSLNGGAETPGLPLFSSNTGRIQTSGLDMSLNYRRELGFGTINIGFTGNYTFEQKFKATPASIDRECVGYYSVNCGLSGAIQPEISWNQRTTLTIGAVDLSYLWRHLGPVRVEPLLESSFFEPYRRIKAYDYFDLSARVGIGDHLSVTATVNNLFDRKPPIVGNTIGTTSFNSGNTYPTTYDALGRRVTIGVKMRF